MREKPFLIGSGGVLQIIVVVMRPLGNLVHPPRMSNKYLDKKLDPQNPNSLKKP